MYIKVKDDKVFGFVRVGYRKHSFRDKNQNYLIKNALWVMDFYVYGTLQRNGYGRVNLI
jgi:hypothetical protein